jgi:hypothetical protein
MHCLDRQDNFAATLLDASPLFNEFSALFDNFDVLEHFLQLRARYFNGHRCGGVFVMGVAGETLSILMKEVEFGLGSF